jgi:hypothetical protein
MSKGPVRAHELIVKIGADTVEDLAWALRTLASDVERGRLTRGCWGSPSDGAIYSYRHDPAMTHDRYFAELDQHLEREAAETRPS